MMLGLGFSPETLMLQLLAKATDPFSGGRSYYNHPSYKADDKPTIIHQSSATGMQAIPTTGIAQGIKYWEHDANKNIPNNTIATLQHKPVVVCSLGDASITEGEVSEALQFAALHQLPILYLVQDNNWGISVTASEARSMTAYEYAAGFVGLNRAEIDGTTFSECYTKLEEIIADIRLHRRPWIVQANVPLLGHHTSGVRSEYYRSASDLALHETNNPFTKLHQYLLNNGELLTTLNAINDEAKRYIDSCFVNACNAPQPNASSALQHILAPTTITTIQGVRVPNNKADNIVMVDAALYAIRELMHKHPEIILYGQDVGELLGGVFRETATLGQTFGKHRVYNTAIQEAYIIGSTIGLNAVGIKPIVEVQFADYIYPGLNQLVSEISKSYYLSNGKFNIQMILRVPCGAYGGGGPYHSGSIENLLLTIKGIKVVYPSNAADMKGLMKAAYYDPNPVVILEHKGLYWSKVPGTETAKTPEPDADYVIPLGIANIVLKASEQAINGGNTALVITYGMGVYWALAADKKLANNIEIIDLRTLNPLDEALLVQRITIHGKCLILTEDTVTNGFAQALSGRLTNLCFQHLDAPIQVLGTADVPAIPINLLLEKEVLPNAIKVTDALKALLNY